MFSKKFICATENRNTYINNVNAPYMRKNFEFSLLPEEISITVCGIGFYEIYVNGVKITKGKLAPYISDPDNICYYDKYDILKYVNQGNNTIAFILGNGIKNSLGGFCWEFDTMNYVGPPQLAFAIEGKINGESFTIESDTDIKVCDSPIIFDDFRTGCHYDARLEIDGWNLPNFDDSAWRNAIIADKPRGEARICQAPSIECYRELSAINISRSQLDDTYKSRYEYEGVKPRFPIQYEGWLYDFGENNTGVVRLELKNTKPGQVIELQHCEYINHLGKPSYNNIFFVPDGYSQRDIYICKGAEIEIYEPFFTYHGFRYCFITGLTDEQVNKETARFLVLSSKHQSRGHFKCSDERINKLQEMCRRSDESNMIYFPNDCPHREKNGWTGDATVSAEQILLNFDFEESLIEWLNNICASQNQQGAFPAYVPTGCRGYKWGNGPIWDNVIVELPYQILRYTGNLNAAKNCAKSIFTYLHYASTKRNDEGLLQYGLGDWLKPKTQLPVASKEFVDSVMIYVFCQQASVLFAHLGMDLEKDYATQLGESIKKSICDKYINNDLSLADDGIQTSQVLALNFNLFDKSCQDNAINNLRNALKNNDWQHDCGMIGIRYLFHVLSKAGYADEALDILLSEGTGYGEFLKHNLTTLPESFAPFDENGDPDFRRSLNHHFLGDISHFFISEIAGIHVNDDVTNAAHIDVKPQFINKLSYAKASFKNDFGSIIVKWKKDKNIVLSIETTGNFYGNIILPSGYYFEDKTVQKSLENNEYKILFSNN